MNTTDLNENITGIDIFGSSKNKFSRILAEENSRQISEIVGREIKIDENTFEPLEVDLDTFFEKYDI